MVDPISKDDESAPGLRLDPDLNLLGRHLAEAAHDLRNPLASILALTELIERATNIDDARELGRRLGGSARQCRGIVDDLLIFARQGQPECVPLRLDDLISDWLDRRPPTPGIEVNLVTDGIADCRMVGSPSRLERLVDNLVTNATSALTVNGAQGEVRMRVGETQDGVLQFSVSDDGPGFSRLMLARGKTAFTGENAEGFGLGLAVADRIAKDHGAVMSMNNGAEGGAEVRVAFPRAKDTVKPLPLPDEKEDTLDEILALNILVVDDDASTLETYGRILGLDGHRVELVSSGREGLARFLSHDFDLAIVDVRLGDFTGPLFFQEVSKSAPHKAARLVFATGDCHKSDTREFLNAIGNPFLLKPFEIKELRAALQLATKDTQKGSSS